LLKIGSATESIFSPHLKAAAPLEFQEPNFWNALELHFHFSLELITREFKDSQLSDPMLPILDLFLGEAASLFLVDRQELQLSG